jgi:hypothetical protein
MGGFSRLDRDDGQQSEMRVFKEKRRTQQNEMAQRVQIAFSNEAASPMRGHVASIDQARSR